jgi:hypothetical protein
VQDVEIVEGHYVSSFYCLHSRSSAISYNHVPRDAPASLLGIIEHRRLCGRDCTFDNIYNKTLGVSRRVLVRT